MRGKGAQASLALDRLAEEMQTPAEYVIDSAHEGSEPWERSFFNVSPASVTLLAIKRAEQGDAVIFRVQERTGWPTQFTIECPSLGIKHSARINKWEIKTLMLTGANGQRGEVRELSLLER